MKWITTKVAAMINEVKDILKKINPKTEYQVRPPIDKRAANTEVISFYFFNERYTLKGDGQGRFIGSDLQVDIFSTRPITDTKDRVRIELEKTNKFIFNYADERIEDIKGERLYHTFVQFAVKGVKHG